MKNIILTATLSVATFFGVLVSLKNQDNRVYELRLPEVEIKAERVQEKMPEITLPEVTVTAHRRRVAAFSLPEVVITARRHPRA